MNIYYALYCATAVVYNTILIVVYYGPHGQYTDIFYRDHVIKTLTKISFYVVGSIFILEFPMLVVNFKTMLCSDHSQESIFVIITVLLNINTIYIAPAEHNDYTTTTTTTKYMLKTYAATTILYNITIFLVLTDLIYKQIYPATQVPHELSTSLINALSNDTVTEYIVTEDIVVTKYIVMWTSSKPVLVFNNDDDDVECNICLENNKNVIYACGHYICCDRCSENICRKTRFCPLCKQIMCPMYLCKNNYPPLLSIV